MYTRIRSEPSRLLFSHYRVEGRGSGSLPVSEEDMMNKSVMEQVVAKMNEKGLPVDLTHVVNRHQLAATRR